MRHFGTNRQQCENLPLGAADGIGQCHRFARRVLFGRLSRAAIMSLGMGVLALVIALGLMSTLNFKHSSPQVRDMGSAVMIKR